MHVFIKPQEFIGVNDFRVYDSTLNHGPKSPENKHTHPKWLDSWQQSRAAIKGYLSGLRSVGVTSHVPPNFLHGVSLAIVDC